MRAVRTIWTIWTSVQAHCESKEMRADSALSHLEDGEPCIVVLKNGERHEVEWSVPCWSFIDVHADRPIACRFEDIKEWMPASIKFHL